MSKRKANDMSSKGRQRGHIARELFIEKEVLLVLSFPGMKNHSLKCGRRHTTRRCTGSASIEYE